MLGEIRDAFVALSAEREVRAIILAAEGKHFSVGADFAFLERLTGMRATEIKDMVYANLDRKRVVEGKSVSVSVDLGSRRIIKQKINTSEIRVTNTHEQNQ